jgi:hypothetical protein
MFTYSMLLLDLHTIFRTQNREFYYRQVSRVSSLDNQITGTMGIYLPFQSS